MSDDSPVRYAVDERIATIILNIRYSLMVMTIIINTCTSTSKRAC